MPAEPTQAMRDQHNLLHVPSAPWCEICIAAKGKDEPHGQISPCTDILPLIEFDYTFLRTEQDLQITKPCLAGVHVQSGFGFAYMVLRKGKEDPSSAPAAVKWLDLWGLLGIFAFGPMKKLQSVPLLKLLQT